jgi:metal-dependent HD superfamily phosphatase/phosphodiesterase
MVGIHALQELQFNDNGQNDNRIVKCSDVNKKKKLTRRGIENVDVTIRRISE